MRLSPWLAPLTAPRNRLADKIVRRKVTRRKTANRLSQLTERLEARTLLTSFTVDSFFDTVDQTPGDTFALDATGQTSLRAAIMEANAAPGSDTIMLGGGIFNLSLEGTDEDGAATGDLDITNDLIIQGQSPHTTTIDARHVDRVFEVFPGVTLQLFNLTITGGDLAGRGDGGGIRVDSATVQLNNVTVRDNRASNGGGIHNNLGMVTVTDSTLSNNRAEGMLGFGQGGAIDSFGGAVTVRQSTVNDNFALGAGGGIAASDDAADPATLIIESSTIAQNSAGEFQSTQGDGGGLYVQTNVNATVFASTVAFNMAGNHGGGAWVNGSLTLNRTIVSNNVSSGAGPEGFISSGGAVSSVGFNLIREDANFNFGKMTSDQVGDFTNPIEPNLLGLTDNGGPTQTIALGGMSPAIDAGPMDPSPLFADQRGFTRDRDGDRNGSPITDIGAFELQSPSDFFVDDIGGGTIVGGRAGDFAVTTDNGTIGVLDAGDIVTFDPDGHPIFNVEFGVRAFGTIGDALAAIRLGQGDSQKEVVLGPGTYAETVLIDIFALTFRGHTGIAADVVIDGGGGTTAIAITEDSVSLSSLHVTNATTGIDVAPFSSAQFFDADNIRVDGTTTGLRVFDSIGLMDVGIRNSTFTGNTGDGVSIMKVGTARLRNVSSTLNGLDGVKVLSTPIVGLDIVTVDQNSGRGLVINGADTIAVMDPRTSASTNGNVFSNSSVLLFNGLAGPVSNSTTLTGTEIQFDAKAGANQEAISLTNIATLFVTGDGGNDTLAIDYSAGNPPASRQLFLDGGPGNDIIISSNDTNQRLTDARLTIGGIDDVAIANFEQAALTGGFGNNNLDASEFDGPVTLSGLAGNDMLRGSSSDDVLDGGADDDILAGGPLHEQYVLGVATFESLDLADTDIGVVTILDETDTETATILLESDIFRYNDVTYAGNTLFVAPSGVASFGGPIFPQNNFDLTNTPGMVGSVPILAPLFDDWVTGISAPPGLTLPEAKVLYKFEDTNADFINDRLIIEWNEVYHRDQIDTATTSAFLKAGASPVTFQMILELNTFDRDGDITFNYVDLDTGPSFAAIADGASATIGSKDGGENPNGVRQVSFNSPNTLVASNKAIVARSAKSDGDDILMGGTGDDILFSTSGLDSIDGGGGPNDRFIFAGFNSSLTSDHTINSLAVESRILQTPGRTVDFKATYSNIEVLDVGFGSADQNVLVELNGLPASVSLDTRGPSASDSVTIKGTAGNDALTLTGTTLDNGTTTLDLGGVGNLTLDISNGGADTISVDQDYTGSARSIIVTGDLSDDVVSLQSTTKQQQVNIFSEGSYNAQVQEVLGGDLVLEEVLNDGGDDGSENTIENQQAPDQVIVSPDGTRVYVAASNSDALVVYGRDRVTGDLTFIESLVNGSMDFHGGTISGLDGASNVIVSADGRYVYVASDVDQTVALFVNHEGDNQLTFITSTVLDVAGNPVSVPLPSDMAFIPDGSFLMVTSETGNRVDFFEVGGSGDLTFQSSLVDGGRDSGMTTIDGLGGASSIAVSPDGRFMYVTGATDGQTGGAIAVFSAPTNGHAMSGFALPLFLQKLANGDMDAGLNVVSGLGGASSVEVSPEGQHVYVTGETGNSIAVFSRNLSTGELTFVESLTDGGLDSMSNTVDNLLAPASVSISPEGTTVYVAASGSNAVTLFARDFSSGSLTFLETLASGDSDGAGTTVNGVNGVSSVFASVDGQHVYASGTGDDAIVRFNVPRFLNVSTDGAAALSVTTSDADDGFSLSTVGQPATLAIDAGGSVDNDVVVIQGSDGDDTVGVDGGTLAFGGTTLTIANAEVLNLFTDLGDDTVNVAASATGPVFFSADGGSQTGADVLNIDAQAKQAVDSGSNVAFSGGLQAVNHNDFETVAITNAAPIIDDDTFAVPEDAAVGTSVGTANAADPEPGEILTWSILSGNTGGAFAISASTGEITVNAALDFEVLASYSLVVEVEDRQSLTDTATITINVTDIEPTVSNQLLDVEENATNGDSVGTVALDTGDQNSVTYRFIGQLGGFPFAINASSGEITVDDSTVIDFEQQPSYFLTVEVTDDAGTTVDTADITININDVAPAISDQSFAVAEDAANSTSVGTVSLDVGDDDSLTFSIDAGNTGNAFAIDSSSGEITVNDTSAIDFEASPSFGLTVSVVDDTENSSAATVTINVSDVEPTISDQSFVVAENAGNGTSVGTVALDAGDENSVAWSITAGNTGGEFSINASSGEITVADTTAIDFEAAASFGLTVTVTDDGGTTTDSATVTVNISDIEPMVGDQSFNVLENQSNGTNVGTVVLDPGDVNSVGFSITGGNTGTAFAINSANGQITIANTAAIDFETGSPFSLIVEVTDDGGTTTDTGTVTVNIQDANEPPIIAPQSFNVDENSVVTTSVGTVLASDFETPSSLTFAITAGDPMGSFLINASTGAITVAKSGLDHESVSSFNLTVQATDPGRLSSLATVTVNIDDVNEAPILNLIGNRSATVDQQLSFTASANDSDSPPATLTFSLGVGAPVGAGITSGGNFTFTPTSAQDGMTFPVTIIGTEGNVGALTAFETIMITVSSVALDFGDAPDSYKTLLVSDGPRHVIGSLFLGSAIDSEVDGQPEAATLGDDNNSTGAGVFVDDENGITFLSALGVGTTRQFRVFATEAGFIDAWIDFDQSGDFTIGENLNGAAGIVEGGGGAFEGGASFGSFNVSTGIAIPAGFSTVSFGIPNTAISGPSIARFRLSSTGGLGPNGLASDGEVEDYLISIAAPPAANSDSIEPALNAAVDGFFNAFPDELNDPDPDIDGTELPLAVQAENGARAERLNGVTPLNQTGPKLKIVIQAINDAVDRLEQDRGADENILVLAFHPVDFLLTDTQGRTVGFTQDTGTVNEIGVDATFTGDGVVELLTIRNADPGEYGLQLVGVGGVFRGGSSLITPAGTQEITFQGSLADGDEVQLALTYQEVLTSFPTRTDLETVDFSEIADFVAQIPTADSDAKTLAAGATEALASIAMDQLDGSLKDDEAAARQRLLKRISEIRKKLLDAIKTWLDDDELESLKLGIEDDGEDAESVEARARVLLETISGRLISAPRQVKELAGTLQQLLNQLREHQEKQQKQKDNEQPANPNDSKGAAKPEGKRTSQRSPAKTPATVVNSSFIVSTDDATNRRSVDQASGTRRENGSSSVDRRLPRESSADAAGQPTDSQADADLEESSVPVKE
jgi:6-phosphogluconolactonase (cycloisomerase 2 family)